MSLWLHWWNLVSFTFFNPSWLRQLCVCLFYTWRLFSNILLEETILLLGGGGNFGKVQENKEIQLSQLAFGLHKTAPRIPYFWALPLYLLKKKILNKSDLSPHCSSYKTMFYLHTFAHFIIPACPQHPSLYLYNILYLYYTTWVFLIPQGPAKMLALQEIFHDSNSSQ